MNRKTMHCKCVSKQHPRICLIDVSLLFVAKTFQLGQSPSAKSRAPNWPFQERQIFKIDITFGLSQLFQTNLTLVPPNSRHHLPPNISDPPPAGINNLLLSSQTTVYRTYLLVHAIPLGVLLIQTGKIVICCSPVR